ncbi:Trimethylguanosine synthase [Apiospora phragmitis]|uniref:Trimethylguanosine synthase n=1 Tax=Apiospora phragmitis TaxID=2905665 RepID=A0ABR1TQI7_9PEZI
MDPKFKRAKKLPLIDECHHWTKIGEVPWDLQKYWQQRYTIFPYYDSGIRLTNDAWFGVTPETVATRIAQDIGQIVSSDKTTLVDLFAGVGANTIAFAQSGIWDRIIAVERDAATLACAQHNAELYEVGQYIEWVHGDSFEVLEYLTSPSAPSSSSSPTTHNDNAAAATTSPEPASKKRKKSSFDDTLKKVDVSKTALFGSPPWGGPGYTTDAIFDLSGMEPYNLEKMHVAYRRMDHALYLPRTSDLRQIARLVPSNGPKIEVVQYCVKGASKAMVTYIPAQEGTATTASRPDENPDKEQAVITRETEVDDGSNNAHANESHELMSEKARRPQAETTTETQRKAEAPETQFTTAHEIQGPMADASRDEMQIQAVTEQEDGKQHNTSNGNLRKGQAEEVEEVESQNEELSREQNHDHPEITDGGQGRRIGEIGSQWGESGSSEQDNRLADGDNKPPLTGLADEEEDDDTLIEQQLQEQFERYSEKLDQWNRREV